MPLKSHDMDPSQWPHQNALRCFPLGLTPNAATAQYLAAANEDTFTTGTKKTVLTPYTPSGTPWNIHITTAGASAAGATTVIRFGGFDHLGRAITEDITIAAATASGTILPGLKVFRSLLTITVVSQTGTPSVGAATTFAIGCLSTGTGATWRVGIPFKPLVSTEVKQLGTFTGTAYTSRAYTVDLANACIVCTVAIGAVTQVMALFETSTKGFRP